MTQAVYTTAGTFTFTAPAGVTSLRVQCWAGAASGAGASAVSGNNGGGGGGGEYSEEPSYTVIAGNSYQVVVGAGGPHKLNAAGVAGGNSTFDGTGVVAHSGAGGLVGANGAGGAGGTGSVNTVHFNGGAGAAGASGLRGGGGGSSAGAGGAGTAGSGITGGTAASDGGGGGNGGNATGVNGSPGTAPGGGGGGAYSTGTASTSGAGGDGQVILTYTAAGAPAAPRPKCGAATGTVKTSDPANQNFINQTQRPLQIRHLFFGNNIPASLASSLVAGDAGTRKVLIDFNLADKSGAGTSVAALDTFLASCAAGGLDAVFTLWHEPYDKFASASAFINALGPYVPVIHAHGYLHAFDPTAYSVDKSGILPAWWPGVALADVIATDLYTEGYFVSGVRLATIANFADTAGVPFGIYEFGVDQQVYQESDGLTFLNYILNFLTARVSAGKTLADVLWWNVNTGAGGTYDLATAPASYTVVYQQIFDLVQSASPGATAFVLLNLSASATGQVSAPSVVNAFLNLSASSATPGFVPPPVPPPDQPQTMPAVTVSAGLGVNSGDTTSTYLFLNDPVRGKLDSGNTLAPFAAADITPWVDTSAAAGRTVTIVRGSNRGEDPVIRYDAGTCQIPLDNTDRRFDPTNLAGPYVTGGVTQVVPMVAIKIQATWAGVTYDLFTGYADQWQLSYSPPLDATVTLTGTDAFKAFAAAQRTALTAQVGNGELSGARVNRILDNLGWPATARQIAAGDTALQGTLLAGSPMDELNLTCDSESGELYIDGSGNVFFRNRRALLTETRSNTSQAQFGDAASVTTTDLYTATYPATYGSIGATELPYADAIPSYDDLALYNLVRIGYPGASTQQIAQDIPSQQQYLPHIYDRSDLLLTGDADALGFAQYVLLTSKNPALQFETITIDPLADPVNLYPQVLGRRIGDRITITRRPPGGGAAIIRDCYIRGIRHEFSDSTWLTVWTLQDATKYPIFILNHPQLGKLGSGQLGY